MSVRFLSVAEAESWCQRNRILLDVRRPDLSTTKSARLRFRIPSDAGARVALSKLLYPTVWQEGSDILVWTTDWSVWPSGEHMPLLTRFRRGFGEDRTLQAAPAQVIDAESMEDGESIVVLNCLFLWDCWILSASGEYGVFLCHDEWGEVYTRSESTRSGLVACLTKMDLLGGGP
jgi:hypothetical protein